MSEENDLLELTPSKIGEITVSLDPIEDEQDRSKCTLSRKVVFNKEENYVCAKWYEDSKSAAKDYEDIIYFAMYAHLNEEERAYHYDESKNEIVFLDGFDRVYYVSTAVLPGGQQPSDAAELFFSGGSYNEIELTAKEIRREYTAGDLAKYILMAVLVFVFVGLLAYIVAMQEEPPPQLPPRPSAPAPLTMEEQISLKRTASIELIMQMNREMMKIADSKHLERRRRIVDYQLQGYDIQPPLQPQQRADGTWYFENGPKRGGLEVKYGLTYEQDFAGVGFTRIGEGVYTKSVTAADLFVEENIAESVPLTEECIRTMFKLPGRFFVQRRIENSFEVSFAEVNASVMLNDIGPLVQKCPAYFESLNVRSAKAQGNIVIYNPNEKRI